MLVPKCKQEAKIESFFYLGGQNQGTEPEP